jgi:hypothetical protein
MRSYGCGLDTVRALPSERFTRNSARRFYGQCDHAQKPATDVWLQQHAGRRGLLCFGRDISPLASRPYTESCSGSFARHLRRLSTLGRLAWLGNARRLSVPAWLRAPRYCTGRSHHVALLATARKAATTGPDTVARVGCWRKVQVYVTQALCAIVALVESPRPAAAGGQL